MAIKSEYRWLIIIALVTFGVFANSLEGEFVYDDLRQIQDNPLVQDTGLIGRALTSDVWAFKGDGTVSASNYWRPTFTAWCIVNFKLFGQSTWGWHFLNILLHIGVCLLAFLLLRRWGVSEILAFSITLIYAVHPVHTESVVWISGSPDLLFGICFLASLWFVENARTAKNKSRDLGLAIVFYLLALGAKEIAVLCFPIYFFIFSRKEGGEDADKSNAVNLSLPFAGAAAVYFFTRWAILGRLSHPMEDAAGTFAAIMSAPAVFIFYLKQIFFPYWLGINYSLRPTEQAGFLNFVFPLSISIAALAAIWLLAKRSFVQKMGAALFLLPLILAFNTGAFPREQIVHDRYLYLPLLGLLMLVLPFLKELAEKLTPENAQKVVAATAIGLSLLLGVRTFFYNRVWLNQVALWENAVRVDDASAINWSQLGAVLSSREETDKAIEAFQRSIAVKGTALSYLGLGRSLITKGRNDEAVANIRKVMEMPPEETNAYTLYQTYEAMGVALQAKGDLAGAEKVFRTGRDKLPIYRAALTEKLAVILYMQNRKQDALNELEAVREQARREFLQDAKVVFLRLGMLYAEAGKKAEAKRDLQEFMQLTAGTQNESINKDRKQADALLRRL